MSPRRRPATSSPCSGCSRRFTARLTKGATSCCDPPSSVAAPGDRGVRAHRQLSAVPAALLEFLRDHSRRPARPASDPRQRLPHGVSLGLVVWTRDQRPGALLDDRGAVAFHALLGARLLRTDYDSWIVDRRDVLARCPAVPPS